MRKEKVILTLFSGFSWFLKMDRIQLWMKRARLKVPVRAGNPMLNSTVEKKKFQKKHKKLSQSLYFLLGIR